MSEKKHEAIAQYLAEHIETHGIEQQHDFDMCAQTFKVHIPNDFLLLKVSDPFIDDREIPGILQQFKYWNLPALLMQASHQIVLVGNEGFQFLPRR